MGKLYYTPPPDELFAEIKQKAIELWPEIDSDNDKFGYATEKINQIKDIQNVGDNFMYIVAMFDSFNQMALSNKISASARKEIRDRIIDGGGSTTYNSFNE